MSKLNTPVFSVIIPTYNRKDLLKIALGSVLDQTFMDLEVTVIDDGSTDKTPEMIGKYNDPRIKYLFQENHGPAHARNRGIELSKGKLIAFLDSDDKWVPQKLERSIEYVNKFPDVKIFHTEEVWYRKGKLLNQKKKHKKPSGFVYTHALPLCCIGISTAIVKRDVFEDIGVFDEGLPVCEDYDFWLRATNRYKVKLIPEYLTIKNGGRPDQLSSQPGLDKYRIKALEKMLSSKKLNKEEYELTYNELSNKCRIYALGAEKRGRSEEVEHYKNLIKKFKKY